MTIKFISPTAHGIIDWLTAGMLPAVPRLMGWDRKVTRVHDIAAGAIAGSSAFTNYPPGLVKLMPMETHLLLDKMNGAMLLAASAIMEDESCTARSCMAGTGAFLLFMGFCTRSQKHEHAPKRGAYARQEPIQRYAEQTRPDIYGRAGTPAQAFESAR